MKHEGLENMTYIMHRLLTSVLYVVIAGTRCREKQLRKGLLGVTAGGHSTSLRGKPGGGSLRYLVILFLQSRWRDKMVLSLLPPEL